MKTRKTTIILFLLGLLFSFPMEQVSAVISATNANVKRSRIKRRSNGLYKMTSVFTGGTDASTIKVDIVRTGDKSPKPLITTFTLKVVGKEENGNFIAEKDFDCIKGKDCLFAKDADPVGYSYKITTVVLDKVDKAISKKVTTEVVAEQEFSAKIKPSGIKVRRLRNRYRITSTRMKILSSRKEDSSFIAENTSIKAEISRVSEGSPKPLITSFTINTTGKDKNGNYISERDFDCIKGKDCLFGIEDNTLGEAYKITMVVVDKNGNAISEKVSTEVKVSLDEECKVKYSLEEMSISGFNFYAPYSEKNTSEYPMLVKRTGTKTNTISIPVSFHRGGGLCVLSGSVRTRKWSKSSSETNVKFNAIFNEKTQTLTANLPDMDSVYLLGFTTKSTICGIKYKTHEVNFNKIESVQGEAINFKLRKVKDTATNGNNNDSTKVKLALSKETKLTSSINGAYQILAVDGVKFTQKGMTFTDLDVEVIVAMKDCKGATTSVAFDLKYNEKTGAFSNSKAIALCNKTGMEILYYDVIAYKKGTSKREKLKKARRRQELYAEENY